jgi:hypothetical protein
VDSLYSGSLLVSLLLGSAAVLGASVRRVRSTADDGWRRPVLWASATAGLAAATSFTVHLLWGHTPGGPAALSAWEFVRAHRAFVVAAALPTVAALLSSPTHRSATPPKDK